MRLCFLKWTQSLHLDLTSLRPHPHLQPLAVRSSIPPSSSLPPPPGKTWSRWCPHSAYCRTVNHPSEFSCFFSFIRLVHKTRQFLLGLGDKAKKSYLCIFGQIVIIQYISWYVLHFSIWIKNVYIFCFLNPPCPMLSNETMFILKG